MSVALQGKPADTGTLLALADRCDHACDNLGIFACYAVMADAHEALEGDRAGWANDHRTIREYAADLRIKAEAAA